MLGLAMMVALGGCGGGGEASADEIEQAAIEGGTASEPSETTTTTTTEPAPVAEFEVGDCLPPATADQLAAPSDPREPIPCDGHRGGEVIHVGTIPEPWSDRPYPPRVDEDDDGADLARMVAGECWPAWEAYVGQGPMVSNLRWYWFVPDPDAWDWGDRRFRCDIAGVAPEGAEFATAVSLRGAEDRALPAELRACLAEGAGGYVEVSCLDPHTIELSRWVDLGIDVDDPSLDLDDPSLMERATDLCFDHVHQPPDSAGLYPSVRNRFPGGALMVVCGIASHEPVEGIHFVVEPPR